MVTALEKRIYNTFLAVSRKKQNKPFKLRENFSNFEQDKNYQNIKKLSHFFNRFGEIDINDFILAPYAIYENDVDAYYELSFYLTQKARKVYSLYMKKKDSNNIESEQTIQKCKDSILFIYKFCKEKKIPLNDYILQKTGCIVPDFCVHLKERKVNIYTLLAIEGFEQKFFEIPKDIFALMFGNKYNDFAKIRMMFLRSDNCKRVCKTGLKEIKKHLK